ncbi:hypothetical protein ACFRKB_15915 [Streptomyces scopuliridis]|uniref:hypothetical protein n=1 Tax=Streptomyces scopuliridis TaxID=452529 RepID=UPI003674A658
MCEQAPGTAGRTAELEATVHSGGFWRLVPESVPRMYDPVTRALLERVLHGLNGLRREAK